MTARLCAIFTLPFIWGLLAPAFAAAQTPAAISYGSIAAAENPLLFSSDTLLPILVAQNTTPAAIAPISPAQTLPPVSNPSVGLPPLDPYATPQPPLFSSILNAGNTNTASGLGQSSPSNIFSDTFDKFMPETYSAIRRFRDATSIEYTHLPSRNRANAFGMDEIDLRMQLAFPCRFIPNNGAGSTGSGYFYAAPGGSLVWWDGPKGPPDMSPNGFGAFLDFGLQPQFNEVFALNVWGRLGIFSDFAKITSDALRFQGRLEGIVRTSSNMQVYIGILYLGRDRVKLLPTGGVVWSPDENWTFKLVFPNPKVSRRLWSGPQADWWGYAHIDYAGGSWDISGLGLTDYNDVRLGMGIEFYTPSRIGGYFEFGGSFARELYSHNRRWAEPPTVLYLKTGIIF